MKKMKSIIVMILCFVMLISLFPASALAEGELCSCGSAYDENGVCPNCRDILSRKTDTVLCSNQKGRLTVTGKIPKNITPALESVYVSEEHVSEWSGIPNAADLSYRLYDFYLTDSQGARWTSQDSMYFILNPEFAGKPTAPRVFRIFEIELTDDAGNLILDEFGKPVKKTVGEEVKVDDWDGEHAYFVYTMPERWLIVATPDDWGLLAMRLARLNGLTPSSENLERLLLAVDEAAQNLRNQGVTEEEIYNHEGLDWAQYNLLRSSVLTNKTLSSGNVTVSGLMPAGARLEVSNVSKRELGDFIEGKELVFAYDITVKYGNGREYQPGEENPLKVVISNIAAAEDIMVTHIEDANTAENIASSVNADGSVVFKAESFSVYIGTTDPPKVDNYSIAAEFGTWDTTLLCGDTPKVVVTVTNPGKYEVKINSVTSDSEHFVITGFPTNDVTPTEKKWTGYLEATHALTAGAFSPKITVTFQYTEDGTTWSEEVTQSFNAPAFTISHNFWGGWCQYDACDCRDGNFSGKFSGGDKRTYFRNNSPSFATNLLYYQYDSIKENVLQHTFVLLIDGKEVPQWAYETYQIENNYTGFVVNNDYLISLRTGKHTIRLTEKDLSGGQHYALSWFRISSAVGTGDEDMTRLTVIMLCGIAGSAATVYEYKRRRKE